MDTATDFDFADGTYRFWLPMPQTIELERNCGQRDDQGKLHPKSIMTLFEQINEAMGPDGNGSAVWIGGGAASPFELNEVIRLGLIGGNHGEAGGMVIEVGPIVAKRLVAEYGYPARPVREVMGHAWRILYAAIVGIDVKKKAPAKPGRQKPSRSIKA